MNFFLDSFSKEALDAHNKYRSMHQVSSVKWSRSLAKEAEAWANKLADENCLRNGDSDDGENLYAISGKTDLKGNEVVEKWYDGGKNYNFGNPSFQRGSGHFTQIVWKNTKEIGVGKAKTSDGKLFVVARYRPAGNVQNRFEQNVFPQETSDPPRRMEKTEPRYSEPERTGRFSDRSSTPTKMDDFYKDFEDMNVGRNGGRSVTRTETVTYDDGTGKKTVITKTYNNGPGEVRTVREMKTSPRYDSDFQDHNANQMNRNDKKEYSPSRKQDTMPADAPKSSTKIDKSFKDQCLSSHNKYRAIHSASPLKWNDDIAKQAQWYAEKLAKARSLKHSSKSERGNMGENLAMFSGDFDSAGVRASDMWYSEVKDYDFSKRGYQGGCGHFTQVVWKDSKEFGLGRAQTPDGRATYVVGRYQPAGNNISCVTENVSPPRR